MAGVPTSRALVLSVVLVACAREQVAASRPPVVTPPPPRAEVVAPAAVERPAPAKFAWQRSFAPASEAGLFAVVRPGAAMRTAARADAPVWTYDGSSTKAVKVVARGEAFVEVELDWVPTSEEHCVAAPFAELGLRLFVREDELVSVTTEGASIELAEGVGINVAPGVPVVGRGEEVTLVAWRFDVPLARARVAAVVGKFYVAARRDGLPSSIGLTEDGRVRLGEHEVAVWHGLHQLYGRSEADPDHVLVGECCLQVAGWRLPASDAGSTGGGGCGAPPGEAWLVKAGTELRWPDRRFAGFTHREFRFHGRPTNRGDMRCFSPTFGCTPAKALRVCAPREAVVRAENPAKPSLEALRELYEADYRRVCATNPKAPGCSR